MKKTLCPQLRPTFFCDLDHTLIYSHRVDLPAQKITVEIINGKSQSFMTEKTYQFFKDQTDVQLVPVTTRSMEQYRRINFFQDARFALVCNGGVLLVNGKSDDLWYTESLELIYQASTELKIAKAAVSSYHPTLQIHTVQNLFFYFKADHPAAISKMMENEWRFQYVNFMYDTSKVYCLPRVLTKGNAIRRFINKYDVLRTIGAGDNLFDVSMLNEVDTAIYPQHLDPLICAKERISTSNQLLSDEICNYLQSKSKEDLKHD